MHALAGNLGWASAPVLLTGIAAAAGWRVAAFVSTAVALVVLATVVLLRDVMADAARPHGEGDVEVSPVGTPFAFLGVGAVWMCFLFFFASTMGFGALQNFGPSVLKNVYGMSLAASASALTA